MIDPSPSVTATGIEQSLDYLLTLSGRGLFLVFIALLYFRKVVWSYQLDEVTARAEKEAARYEAELARCRAETLEWKQSALNLLGHAQHATTIAAESVQQKR